MKKVVSFLFLVGLAAVLYAQTIEVKFRELSYEEALKVAETEHKLLFLDAYTSWCAPCKKMEKEVFTRSEVGQLLNTHFVCVKYDIGNYPELQKRLKINAYPTFLILRADGTEQHRIVGGCDAEEFMQRVKEGLDQRTARIFLQEAYERGDRSVSLLFNYALALLGANQIPPALEVADELWKKLNIAEKQNSHYWPLYADFRITPITGERFQFLLDYQKEIAGTVGVEVVNAHFYDVYSRYLYPVVAGLVASDETDEMRSVLHVIDRQMKKIDLPVSLRQTLNAKLQIASARLEGNIPEILNAYEQGYSYIPETELWQVISSLSFLREKGQTEELLRAAVIAEKSASLTHRAELKGYLNKLGEGFRKRARSESE